MSRNPGGSASRAWSASVPLHGVGSGLVVKEASRAQWLKTHEHEYKFWGGGLSLEDFSRREVHLCEESALGLQGWRPWVLVPEDNIETLDLLAFCETFARPVLLKSGEDAAATDSICHSVLSVFTPESYRRRGYAQRLLSMLHAELARESPLSVLFSDIGNFYSRVKPALAADKPGAGWELVSPVQVTWSLDDDVRAQAAEGTRLHWLAESDLPMRCKQDVQLVREDIGAKNEPAFAILPTHEQVIWHIQKTKWYEGIEAPLGRKGQPRLEKWGCELRREGTSEGTVPFAIWTYGLAKKEVSIIRLRCSTATDLRLLVQAAQQAGKEAGMQKITAWNVEQQLLEGTGWENAPRNSSLPAVAWYGSETSTAPRWCYNEHFAWC